MHVCPVQCWYCGDAYMYIFIAIILIHNENIYLLHKYQTDCLCTNVAMFCDVTVLLAQSLLPTQTELSVSITVFL